MRTDWTRAEIADLFDLPFTELVFRAAEVHRAHHAAGEVQLCTLLSSRPAAAPRIAAIARNRRTRRRA
jgi:biotin synthase